MYAHRQRIGTAITCDEAEAEVSTPPIVLNRGVSSEIDSWVRAASHQLVEAVPNLDLEGCSSHISMSAPEAIAVRAAGIFSRTFAPAVMLLMERQDSLGLLVRPRAGRIEIGGDFVTGEPLLAAALMVAGGARMAYAVAAGERPPSSLAPAVAVDVVPAVDRFGWYVDRSAFGFDLYDLGTAAVFRREQGGELGAMSYLAAAWSSARRALRGLVGREDRRAIESMLRNVDRMPLSAALSREPPRPARRLVRSEMGSVLDVIYRPSFSVQAVVAIWDFTVFRVNGRRHAFVTVPRNDLAGFLGDARTGRLDEPLERYLAANPRGAILETYYQGMERGVYDEMGPAAGLAPAERHGDGIPRLRIGS